jgi:CubicO group peptidase (beta-lactamase class C family)
MRADAVPGLAFGVLRGGELLHAAGLGVADVDSGQPVTPGTLFRIGSVTKPMTGTLLMALVDRGQLELDRPIRNYVDWLELSEPGAVAEVTLRRLMTHTAGLSSAEEHEGARDADGLARHVRQVVATAPLVGPPGLFYSYSNLGLDLAGFIAETVTGRPFDELMREQVFEPAGMTRTTLDPTVAMTYPLAQAHDLDEDGRLFVRHRYPENVGHHPSGFVISCVADLAAFARCHVSGGMTDGRRVLSAGAVAEMHKPQIRLPVPGGIHSGLTFAVREHKGVTFVSHDGGIATFGCQFILAPDRQAAAFAVYNRLTLNFHAGVTGILQAVLDELLERPEKTTASSAAAEAPAEWPRFVGHYLGSQRGLIRVHVEGGLQAEVNGESTALQRMEDDLYMGELPSGPSFFQFVSSNGAPASHVLVDATPCRRIDPPGQLPAEPLGDYAGTYRGDMEVLRARVDGDHLFVAFEHLGSGTERPAIPLGGGTFATDNGVVRFRSGGSEVIVGDNVVLRRG